ncbi:iron donor protein CyaY [Orbus sturtevantii]|uniref:iron donor protein CyaY n=1 Tax=Orbus sturtevantii TaxID=3074109 RepID=UPI00370D03F7
MNTNQFYELANQLFIKIEQQLDDYAEQHNTDIDYERHGNVITITFENQSKIIINTQEPLLQIWMATRRQGYHFDYKDGEWICSRSGNQFNQLFDDATQDQINH